MSEIIFEVHEDEVDGGYIATALGYGIHTQGDTVEELRAMVKDAVKCYFDESTPVAQNYSPSFRSRRSPGPVKLPRNVSGPQLREKRERIWVMT